MAARTAVMLSAGWVAIYCGLTLIRATMAWRYSRTCRQPGTPEPHTILQPILSGDPDLAQVLRRNAEANPGARIFWLIDDDDAEARRIGAARSYGNVRVLSGPPPNDGENPKLAKLHRALPYVETPVLLVVDDDTSIDPRAVAGLMGPGGALRTGMPVFVSKRTLYERLVGGFVNGSALLTYFSCSAVGAQRTINGMIYAVRTESLRALGGFAGAGGEITDDYAMARLYERNGCPVVQTAAFAQVGMSIGTPAHFARVMRRWMIFANRYFRQNTGPATLLLAALPGVLPIAGFAFAPWSGVVACVLGKAAVNRFLLWRIAGHRSSPLDLLFETAADFSLPFWWLAACVRPSRVRWRSRNLDTSTGTIRYR